MHKYHHRGHVISYFDIPNFSRWEKFFFFPRSFCSVEQIIISCRKQPAAMLESAALAELRGIDVNKRTVTIGNEIWPHYDHLRPIFSFFYWPQLGQDKD